MKKSDDVATLSKTILLLALFLLAKWFMKKREFKNGLKTKLFFLNDALFFINVSLFIYQYELE